jgi:hypothetical protein
MEAPWTLETFRSDDGSIPLQRFLDGLSDDKFNAADTAIQRVLAVRGIELVRTQWLKPLGGGLHEFRVRHDAAEICRMFGGGVGPEVQGSDGAVLLRIFVHFYGDKVVLLLGGYDKRADPKSRRQQREIAAARRLLGQFKARRRR